MNQNNYNPQIEDNLTFCPSFNCYTTSSSSSAAAAAIKISNSLSPPDHDNDNDNEFNFVIEEDDSATVYPVFNQNCDTLQSLFITERQDDQQPDTSSSDEEDEEKNVTGAVFCVWKGKSDTSSSEGLSKCKKSRSTGSGSGSGSKRWRIRDYLLRRSNSEGKEAVMLVTNNNGNNKKVSVEKVKRISVENNGRAKPSVHEIFYVQNRAKTEDGKRRSYLPYRQGLVGFFTNVNGKGKSFPF